MPGTFVQGNSSIDSSGSASSLSVSFGSNNTAGNALIIAVAIDETSGQTISSVTDSAGNVFEAVAAEQQTPHPYGMQVFVAPSCVGGANTVTLHASGVSAQLFVLIHEYSFGSGAAAFVEDFDSGSGSGTITSGNLTANQTNDLLFAFAIEGGGGASVGAGSGFTLRENPSANAGTEDQALSATGTYNATFTGAGGSWGIWAVLLGAVVSDTDAATESETGRVGQSGSDSATESETGGVGQSGADSATESEAGGIGQSGSDAATESETAWSGQAVADSGTVTESASVSVQASDSGVETDSGVAASAEALAGSDSGALGESGSVTVVGGFRNQDYIYNHLPGRFRRADAKQNLLLYRFLQAPAAVMDQWDAIMASFYEMINPTTAPPQFVAWWMFALFGWYWYPSWFSIDRMRSLYEAFTQHLARRGTANGIELFLAAFSIHSTAVCRPMCWGQFAYGGAQWAIAGPLGVVVQVRSLDDEVNFDTRGMMWGSMCYGQGFYREAAQTLTRRQIEDLIRFEWPNGQRVMVEYVIHPNVTGETAWDETAPILNESWVPDEAGETMAGLQI
jgi:hypothetical protein